MKKVKLTMGGLFDAIQEFKNIRLTDNKEVPVHDLGCYIPSPDGEMKLINHFIKKENLPGIEVVFNNGHRLICAAKHQLVSDCNTVIFAKDLRVGSRIRTNSGEITVREVLPNDQTTFLDIGIDNPHLYVDAHGIIHHNTLITATLSRSVEQYGRSLVIVPNKSLVVQTEEDYVNLGLDVGVYFGDRKELNKTHTICTWQSLNNLLKLTQSGEADFTINDFIEGVVCVIVDEVHQAKAEALKTLLTGVLSQVPIRWGLTGTIPKSDFDKLALLVSLGPVVGKLAASELQEQGVLAKCHVNIVQLKDQKEYKDYQSELKFLTTDQHRLDTIAKLIDKIKDTGNTLVLVDRISSGKELVDRLPGAVFVSGEMKLTDRKEEYDEIRTNDNCVVIATYGVAAVGINIPRIFNLVLLEPGKSFVRVIQSIGRSLRIANDKDHAEIWDITSDCKFAKRHLTQRKTFYKEASYPFSIEKLDY
jgi:hypothetical protein